VTEASLRGQRGRIIEDYDRQLLERTDPVPGHDVHLTIDLDLQDYTVRLLREAVEADPDRTGAAAVVIEVATREVRALASYPVYSYERFNDDYDRLQRDAKGLPLLFRAVQAQYPPGSICKAITLIGGLSEGVVTADTRIHCTGHLLPDQPDQFRCWIYNMYPGITHDLTDDPAGQEAESAVRNSCNIYFYTVGGLLGPERLCQWFSRFGLGRPAGTDLIEESLGIVPTEAWLLENANRRHQISDAWNFSIGQGEVTISPLQAANVAATIASGLWEPVRLAYDQTGHAFGPPPAPPTAFDDRHLQVLRRGMWRVVNERGGTGPWAKLDTGDYELCGKTGSAQAQPRPIAYRYTFEWPDGRREELVAYLEEDALARFGDDRPRRVGKHTAATHPKLAEGQRLPTHAWFIG
jgi:penicillin-binding protein 2